MLTAAVTTLSNESSLTAGHQDQPRPNIARPSGNAIELGRRRAGEGSYQHLFIGMTIGITLGAFMLFWVCMSICCFQLLSAKRPLTNRKSQTW